MDSFENTCKDLGVPSKSEHQVKDGRSWSTPVSFSIQTHSLLTPIPIPYPRSVRKIRVPGSTYTMCLTNRTVDPSVVGRGVVGGGTYVNEGGTGQTLPPLTGTVCTVRSELGSGSLWCPSVVSDPLLSLTHPHSVPFPLCRTVSSSSPPTRPDPGPLEATRPGSSSQPFRVTVLISPLLSVCRVWTYEIPPLRITLPVGVL